MVKIYSLVGGGLRGAKIWVWESLWWPQTTTKGGGVDGVSAETGQWVALQVTLVPCGAYKKNSKNITRLET